MFQSSRIPALNRGLQDAATWLRELARMPPFQSEEQAYAAFRAVIHSLRDRLEMHEAVHFSGHMPTLERGIYYEVWVPSRAPNDERTLPEFLASVRESLGPGQPADAMPLKPATRVVLRVLRAQVQRGTDPPRPRAAPAPRTGAVAELRRGRRHVTSAQSARSTRAPPDDVIWKSAVSSRSRSTTSVEPPMRSSASASWIAST